jgi:hypothetical protein
VAPSGEARRRGARIAALLAGSWRASPPVAEESGLRDLAPLLHRSGSAALAGACLRSAAAADEEALARLRETHRMQTLAAALHRRHVAHVFEVFRRHGIEPILFKGWAAARAYAHPGMRPSGDVDICVRPEVEERARVAHAAVTAECSVDVHLGLRQLDDYPLDRVFARSEDAALENGHVRILAPEDHLRLLALHALRHGVWRPVWLVDVAAAVEGRSARFDWDLFQSGSARRSQWVAAVVGLARTVLKADLTGVPAAIAEASVPAWAEAAILDGWGSPINVAQGARLPMRHLRNPRSVVPALWRRWPGPLEATIGAGAPMNGFPRWPIQVAACAFRLGRFLSGREADGS